MSVLCSAGVASVARINLLYLHVHYRLGTSRKEKDAGCLLFYLEWYETIAPALLPLNSYKWHLHVEKVSTSSTSWENQSIPGKKQGLFKARFPNWDRSHPRGLEMRPPQKKDVAFQHLNLSSNFSILDILNNKTNCLSQNKPSNAHT